jgi:hypothetical protein
MSIGAEDLDVEEEHFRVEQRNKMIFDEEEDNQKSHFTLNKYESKPDLKP